MFLVVARISTGKNASNKPTGLNKHTNYRKRSFETPRAGFGLGALRVSGSCKGGFRDLRVFTLGFRDSTSSSRGWQGEAEGCRFLPSTFLLLFRVVEPEIMIAGLSVHSGLEGRFPEK